MVSFWMVITNTNAHDHRDVLLTLMLQTVVGSTVRSREGPCLSWMLLIEVLGNRMLGLLRVGWSLHVVWYHARLEWSLGMIEGGPGRDGKHGSGLGIVESV